MRLKIRNLLAAAAVLSLLAAIACAAEEPAAPAAPQAAQAAAPAAVAQEVTTEVYDTTPSKPAMPVRAAPASSAVQPDAPQAAASVAAAGSAPVRTATVSTATAELGYTPFTPPVVAPGAVPTMIYTGPRPTQFTENPKFADLVKAGKPCGSYQATYADFTPPASCPPLAERVPVVEDRMIWPVLDEIGVYGGTKRLVEHNVTTIFHHASAYSLFRNDYNVVDQVPFVAKTVDASADGRTYTVTLRKGTRWSDGKFLTMEDFIWVWEDLNYNKERFPKGYPTKDPVTGNPVQFKVVDDNTFSLGFDTPYFTFLEGKFSGTPSIRGRGWFAHKPWNSQWIPKYNEPSEMQAKLDAFGVEDFNALITKVGLHRSYYQPWVGPFYKPPNGELWGAGSEWHWRSHDAGHANPYYWGFDPHGQQLPYLDGMDALTMGNREAAIFRAMNGESDGPQGRGFQVAELPLYHQHMVDGDFSVQARRYNVGNDSTWTMNMDFKADEEWARLLRTKDFRVALSTSMNRESINDIAFMGLGVPQNHWPHPQTPYTIGEEYRTLDAIHDMARAEELMTKMGYSKNSDGYLTRLDGTGILEFEWWIGDWQYTVGEVTCKNWIALGIKCTPHATYGSDYGAGLEQMSSPTDDSYGHSPWWIYWYANWAVYGGRGILPCAGSYYFTAGEEGCAPNGPDAAVTDIYGNTAPAGTYAYDMSGVIKRQQDMIKEGEGISFFDPRRKALGQEIYKTSAEEKMYFSTVGFAPVSVGIWRNNQRNIAKCCGGSYGDTSIHYFEDGKDNMNNPGNKSNKYQSWSFALQ